MRHLSILLVVVAGYAADPPAAWTPAHQMKFKNVGDVTPSPDGKLVAWTQTAAVMEGEKSEFRTHIFLARADGSGRVQLTRGEKSAASPQFSPDGGFVLFASDRTGKRNLYRIAVAGGEAEQLTDWKGALGGFQVSPDGRQIAFTGAEEDKDEEKRKKEKNDFKVIDANPRNHTLWAMPLEGEMPGTPRRLVAATYHVGSFTWSPDSRHIACEHRPTPEADDARRSDIAEVEVASAAARELVATPAGESQPRYSPDGRYLAFTRTLEGARRIDGVQIVLFTRADGKTRPLAPTPDESPFLMDWTADSTRILFSEPRGVRTVLYAVAVDGPVGPLFTPRRGTLGMGSRLNRAGTHLGLTMQTTEDPVEAYVVGLASGGAGAPVRVSEANTALTRPPLGKTELIRWKSKDGLEIEGLLTYPPGYETTRKAPLILNIHGGPAGVFGESFIGGPGLYPIATFAAKGYAVLRPNPRGSSGYGLKFRKAVAQDWGGLDFQDLMAGVDRVVALGVADPARLAVMGWSYGGYMTAWTVTQTTRFKAAAMGAGITNHVSMYGTQDIPSVYEDYFGGTPWEQPAVYAKSSPMNFIAGAKTPTLILHGEQDARVPIGQAFEFYRALKKLGVETKMVTYPRTPHGPNEPKFTLHVMEQNLEWVEKHLR